jgi:hypothetical protein
LSFDAHHSPLSDRIRALGFAPDLREILAELADRTEPPADHAEEFERMLADARPRIPPPRGPQPRHRRDRHGMYQIPGGLAAFALPAALIRWVARTRVHQLITAAAALSVAGAAAIAPAVASQPAPLVPHPHAIAWHHLGHGSAGAVAPVPGLPLVHRRRRHRYDDDDAVRPSPSASPSGAPSPSATPVQTPVPVPTATGPVPTPTPTVREGPHGRAGPAGMIWLAIVRGEER